MFKYLYNLLFPNKVTDKKDLLNEGSRFDYFFNDPSTSDLKTPITLPKYNQVPPISVLNLNDKNKSWRAKQVYATLAYTVQYVQKILEKDITSWPGTKTLSVNPEAGKQFNAYYDRRNLKFFYDVDPVTKKTVFTADSADVVAHEMGHAILDSIRPDFWNMQALEIWSFHEAWADVIAMLSVMQHDEVIDYALKETNGDLRKSSIITRLAEQMGLAIYNLVGGKGARSSKYLRDANNNFKYKEPERLPENAPDNELAGECHSFGRVFLAAWYDIFVEIYKKNCVTMQQKPAFVAARDAAAYLFLNAVRQAPATPRFYDSMAKTMLFVDKANGSKYQTILNNVFTSRLILKQRVKSLSNIKFDDLILSATDRVLTDKDKKIKAVVKSEFKTMKLADHFGIRAQSNNPLYQADIEIPSEVYMEFNENGDLIEEIRISEKKIIDSARTCIKQIHENDLLSKTDDDDKPFAIVDGKLIRKYIV